MAVHNAYHAAVSAETAGITVAEENALLNQAVQAGGYIFLSAYGLYKITAKALQHNHKYIGTVCIQQTVNLRIVGFIQAVEQFGPAALLQIVIPV